MRETTSVLEYLISTSSTFKTKWVAQTPMNLLAVPVWVLIGYHSLLLLWWVVALSCRRGCA